MWTPLWTAGSCPRWRVHWSMNYLARYYHLVVIFSSLHLASCNYCKFEDCDGVISGGCPSTLLHGKSQICSTWELGVPSLEQSQLTNTTTLINSTAVMKSGEFSKTLNHKTWSIPIYSSYVSPVHNMDIHGAGKSGMALQDYKQISDIRFRMIIPLCLILTIHKNLLHPFVGRSIAQLMSFWGFQRIEINLATTSLVHFQVNCPSFFLGIKLIIWHWL